MVSSWDRLSTTIKYLYIVLMRKGKTTKNEKEQVFAYNYKKYTKTVETKSKWRVTELD